jgi:hypothetical protein
MLTEACGEPDHRPRVSADQQHRLVPATQRSRRIDRDEPTQTLAQTPLHAIVPSIRHAPRRGIPGSNQHGNPAIDGGKQSTRHALADANRDPGGAVFGLPIRLPQFRWDHSLRRRATVRSWRAIRLRRKIHRRGAEHAEQARRPIANSDHRCRLVARKATAVASATTSPAPRALRLCGEIFSRTGVTARSYTPTCATLNSASR